MFGEIGGPGLLTSTVMTSDEAPCWGGAKPARKAHAATAKTLRARETLTRLGCMTMVGVMPNSKYHGSAETPVMLATPHKGPVLHSRARAGPRMHSLNLSTDASDRRRRLPCPFH
jgi:hypothetical protein